MFIGWSAAAPEAAAQDDASARPGAAQDDTVADCPADRFVVATKPLEPFVFVDDRVLAGIDEGGPGVVVDGAELSGFSIDYWNEVAASIGVETCWYVRATVGDIIDSAAAGEVDAAIAGISITRDREAVVDFSQPYYSSGQQVVTRTAAGGGVLGVVGSLVASRTFLVPLAGLVFLVILVSHLVWLFERGHDSDDFPHEYRKGIGEALWWSTVSVITGGEAVKNINTTLSRLIAIMWMLVGLFLLAFITARATSVMTVAELQSDISGIDDLAGHSVSTVADTNSVTFLQTDLGIQPRQVDDLGTALDDLVAERTDAVVFDAPVVAYEVNKNYADALVLVGPVAGRDPYGIALPPGSDRLEEVNGAVIDIDRGTILDSLLTRWFGG